MNQSQLRRLNRIFEPFGRLTDGRLRVRFFDTYDNELKYFIEDDRAFVESELTRDDGTLTTLHIAKTIWKAHYWGDRIGRGWVLCIWKPPLPRDQFEARYGNMAPYPSRGEYQVIENAKFDLDSPPNEKQAKLLRKLLEDMFYRGADAFAPAGNPGRITEILDSLAGEMQRKEEATKAGIMDELDDLLPAFGKAPGKRGGGVSIGGF